jgi:hypothetical protein
VLLLNILKNKMMQKYMDEQSNRISSFTLWINDGLDGIRAFA